MILSGYVVRHLSTTERWNPPTRSIPESKTGKEPYPPVGRTKKVIRENPRITFPGRANNGFLYLIPSLAFAKGNTSILSFERYKTVPSSPLTSKT